MLKILTLWVQVPAEAQRQWFHSFTHLQLWQPCSDCLSCSCPHCGPSSGSTWNSSLCGIPADRFCSTSRCHTLLLSWNLECSDWICTLQAAPELSRELYFPGASLRAPGYKPEESSGTVTSVEHLWKCLDCKNLLRLESPEKRCLVTVAQAQ